MKNIASVLSLTVLVAAFGMTAKAQGITWSAPMPVAAASFGNEHPRIALTASGNPVVLWGHSMMNAAHFARWTGSAFSTPVMLNPMSVSVFSASWAGPDIAAKGDTVYVVYKAEPEDTGYIFLRRSVDGGLTFGAPVQVTGAASVPNRFPAIGVDDAGHPIIGIMRFGPNFINGNWSVTKSSDWGTSFPTDVAASGYNGEEVCDCCPGAIASRGANIAMLYRNNWNNKRTIWAGISSNGGASFPAGKEVDNTNWVVNACPSTGPDGVIVGDTLYTVFMSGGGGVKVHYSKSTLAGTWSSGAIPAIGIVSGIANQNYPRIAADGNTAAMVWRHAKGSKSQIGMLFTTNIQSGFPQAWDSVVTSNNPSSVENVDVAIKGGTIHLVWEDGVTGQVMYRKGTFAPTGITLPPVANVLWLAPVPADNSISVALSNGATPPVYTVTITDATGHQVYKQQHCNAASVISISTAGLQDGAYLLQVTSANGVQTQKFVVHHAH